jgi:hypothetical protein
VSCSERLGYGGDAAATMEAMMLNFDMSSFFEKRVLDFNAGVPGIAQFCVASMPQSLLSRYLVASVPSG